jgi:hypothetical protein
MQAFAPVFAVLLVSLCSISQAQMLTPALRTTESPRVDPKFENVPVSLEIRIVAVDRTRTGRMGFDLSVPNFDTQIGTGLLGFLSALQREGLVPYDGVVSEVVRTGHKREFSVPWSNPTARGAADKWQRLSMRFDAALVTPHTLDLNVWCAAAHAADRDAAPDFKQKLTFGVRDRGQGKPFLISTRVRPVDPSGVQDHEVDVLAIVTPRWTTPEEKQVSVPSARYPDGILFDTIAVRR